MRRVIVVIIVVMVLACIAVSAIVGLPPGLSRNGASAQTALRKATIDRGDLKITVSATGSVVANQQSNLSFDQPGMVKTTLVKEGQKVEAGQILATEDDTTQQANLVQANYTLKSAQAALDELLKPVDAGDIANAEANVKTAEANYASAANSTTPGQIKAAEAQYQQAAQAAQDAESIRKDTGGRFADPNSEPTYIKSIAAVGAAQFNAEIARLKVEQIKRGVSLIQQTANIAYYQALLAQVKAGPSQSSIDNAQAQVALAKVQRDQAQHLLDQMSIKAPYGGVVSTVNIKAGELSSDAAVVITDNSDMAIDVKVDETDIGRIEAGQPVDMTLDALTDVRLTGKVQSIAQTANASSSVITYLVRVVLDPTTVPIKVGMTANAIFTVHDLHNVVLVPNFYLKTNRTTNQTIVTLSNRDGSTTVVPVTLGEQGTDYSEVLDGLNEGDSVVLLTDNSTTSGSSAASN